MARAIFEGVPADGGLAAVGQGALQLAEARPLIFVHALLALLAVALGAALLAGTKGGANHRSYGWIWVSLMAGVVFTSLFIRGGSGPWGLSWIHGLTAFTAVMLPLGVHAARQHRVHTHRPTMRWLYVGACLFAGAFTLLPNRLLGRLIWHHGLGWT